MVVAGAGRPPLGGDGLAASSVEMTAGTNNSYEVEDEGVGMDEGYGPEPPPPAYSSIADAIQPSWHWNNIGPSNSLLKADEDADGDIASDIAEGGDEDGGFEDPRLLEDFGDDFGHSGHQNSPTVFPLGQDGYVPDMDIMDMGPDGLFEDDGPVADIHIEDSPPLEAQGDHHVKTE